MNPGPHFHNSFFNFMNWNLNSLVGDNFQRVRFIEAHQPIFNYDLIFICESWLNDSVELPETLRDKHIIVHPNNPAITHDMVGATFLQNFSSCYRQKWFVFRWINYSWIKILVENKNSYSYISKSFFQPTSSEFQPSWQILKIYTLKSKLKNLLQHFYRWC